MEFAKLLCELEMEVVASPMKFAGTVVEQFEAMTGIIEGEYPRLLTTDQSKPFTCALSQTLLIAEGLAFALHALSRISFRRQNERLRQTIVDPIQENVIQLYARMWAASDKQDDDEKVIALHSQQLTSLIAMREQGYGDIGALLSDEDDYSVLHEAVREITDGVLNERKYPIRSIVRLELLRMPKDLNLPDHVMKLEVLL